MHTLRVFTTNANRNRKHLLLLLLLFLSFAAGSLALKDVTATIPKAATIGDTVTLQCRYDLEGEPLYTVKWYKGQHEFFRYVPKELPSTQIFPQQGINVDVHKSNPNAVVLTDVQQNVTGKYRCEVSSDAPNFYTHIASGYMYVISVPEGKPMMAIEKDSHEIGYPLRGNCTSPPSYPPMNLTWFLNGRKVNESFLAHIVAPNSVSEGKRKPVITVAGLELEIDGNTFQAGKARLRCVAEIFNIYQEAANYVIEEERPQPYSVLGTIGASSGSSLFYSLGILKAQFFILFFTR